MSSSRRSRVLVVGAAALLALVAGCGGPSSAAGGPASSDGAAPAGPAPSGGGGGGDSDEFCGLLKAQLGGLDSTEVGELVSGGTPQEWRAYLEKSARQNDKLVDAAPDEIHDEAVLLRESTGKLRAELEKVGYDLTKLDPAALSGLSAPEVTAASQKLQAFATSECGITPPSASASSSP